MDNGDWVATYAAIVATGALFLEIRRWVESGPNLSIMCRSDHFIMTEEGILSGRYFAVTVSNSGSAATTITECAIANFSSFIDRLRRKPSDYKLIFYPGLPNGYRHPMPTLISPGTVWSSTLDHEGEIPKKSWVWIKTSHRKKPYLRRIPESFEE